MHCAYCFLFMSTFRSYSYCIRVPPNKAPGALMLYYVIMSLAYSWIVHLRSYARAVNYKLRAALQRKIILSIIVKCRCFLLGYFIHWVYILPLEQLYFGEIFILKNQYLPNSSHADWLTWLMKSCLTGDGDNSHELLKWFLCELQTRLDSVHSHMYHVTLVVLVISSFWQYGAGQENECW